MSKTVTVEIMGMTCPNCVKAIETSVMKLKGVVRAEVALEAKLGEFELAKDSPTSAQDIIKCINANKKFTATLSD